MQEKEIETLYPINKNNKKRNIIIILIVIILLIGAFVVLKSGDLTNSDYVVKEEQNNTTSNEVNESNEEISKEQSSYTEFLCEKNGSYGSLDNKISYKNNYRYEFYFDWDKKTVTMGKYIIDYIFNNLTDYNNATNLPINFNDTFYEEKHNEENLTKTLVFYYILEYPNISQNDYLNSYLNQLRNEQFSCKSVE